MNHLCQEKYRLKVLKSAKQNKFQKSRQSFQFRQATTNFCLKVVQLIYNWLIIVSSLEDKKMSLNFFYSFA